MTDDTMIEEFKIEAQEMFESSEDGFLKIERGEDFIANFNLIFRNFHSLKGAAGMFGLDDLQSHMHKLESLFEAQKSFGKLDKSQIDYFLEGIDGAKSLLEGQSIQFKYYTIDEFQKLSQLPAEKLGPDQKKVDLKISSQVSLDVRQKHGEQNKTKRGLFYIVDDEDAILEILSDLIKDMGFEVKIFNNAPDLLKEISDDTPDVLLSDIRMPEMDGVELLKNLREREIETPVILISGYISKDAMLDALEHGAYGFIEKPFNDVYLKNICENAFAKVQVQKLLHKSINYILYQFSDLDSFLKDQGKDLIRNNLKAELANILEQQKTIRQLNKSLIKRGT